MAFNPKAVKGYNKRYRRIQGPARGRVLARVHRPRRRVRPRGGGRTVFGRGLGGHPFGRQKRAARTRVRKARGKVPHAPHPAPGLPPLHTPAAFRMGLPTPPVRKLVRTRKTARENLVRNYFKTPGARLHIQGSSLRNVNELARGLGVPHHEVMDVLTEGRRGLPSLERQKLDRAFKVSAPKLAQRQRYAASLATPEGGFGRLARNEHPDTKIAGFNLSKFGRGFEQRAFPAGTNLKVLEAPVQVGAAIAEKPGSTLKATGRGALDMVVGLPSATAQAVTHPRQAVKALAKDYARRYGPLAAGDTAAFRRRIEKEGFAPEAVDLAAIAAPEGRILGRGLKTTARGREFMEAPRPSLRISGATTREQRLSPNALTVGVQRAHDVARGKRVVRKVKRAEATSNRVGGLEASVKPGEVLPLRVKRRQVKGPVGVATQKGRGLQAMRAEQSREVHAGATRNIAGLDKHERQAFKYAMQLGLPGDAARASELLGRRRAQIVAARQAEGTVIPKALAKTNDELPVIDSLIQNADQAFTPRLRQVVDQERQRELRVAGSDPALVAEQRLLRRHAPQAEFLRVARQPGEKTPAYVRRVKQEAAKQGLHPPAYFPSQKRPTIRYSSYALGGTKAVAEDKRYTGALFRTGREDVRPQAYTESLARNIKRKHNWNTVADNFDAHSFRWGRNNTIGQLLDELDRRNVDPNTVAFWNPGKYREARNTFEQHGTELERTGMGEEPVAQGLTAAVDQSAVDAKGLATKGNEFRSTSGWSVVPKAVYDEIHADTRPSGKTARSWDIAVGKQARLLLGTSPPWEAFQVAANTLQTGLAGTGPLDVVKAQVWWRRLSDQERQAVEPYVGLGPHQIDVTQTHLGASTNARLVNAYRAFKQTPLMVKAKQLNPLDALFRFDNAQNNFFRKSVLYSQAKRDAYARMGQNVSLAADLQNRLEGLLTLGPEEQIKAVLRDRQALERHAGYVNEMLGDYVTYSAKERRILKRAVMFYGFLRFSLNFTFWTMPVKHPIVTALIGNLGRIQTQEVRDLLGGNELPFALGKLYFTKDGHLQSIDLSRANPAANIITQAVSDPRPFGKLIAALPPVVSTALDIAYEKAAYKGKSFRVRGETGYAAASREAAGQGLGTDATARIALRRVLSLAFPYRVWEGIATEGVPQGEDTLAWSPRPTKYKDPTIVGTIAKEKRRVRRRPLERRLVEQFAPFLPRDTHDPELAKAIRVRRKGSGHHKKGSFFGAPPKSGGGYFDHKKQSGKGFFD